MGFSNQRSLDFPFKISDQESGRDLTFVCAKLRYDMIRPHCRESLSLVAAALQKSSKSARTRKRSWKQIFF
jgi:hypothetical protein